MGGLGLVTCRVPVYGLAGIEGEKLAPPLRVREWMGLSSSNVRRYRALLEKSLVVRIQSSGRSHLVGKVVQPLQRVIKSIMIAVSTVRTTWLKSA